MKKRLSFLIAVIMVLSLLPAMSVSAATTRNTLVAAGGSVASDYRWGETFQSAAFTPFLRIENTDANEPIYAYLEGAGGSTQVRFSLVLNDNLRFDLDELDRTTSSNFRAGGGDVQWLNNYRLLRVAANGNIAAPHTASDNILDANTSRFSPYGYDLHIISPQLAEVVLVDNSTAASGEAIPGGSHILVPLPVMMNGDGAATVSVTATNASDIAESTHTVAVGVGGTTKTTILSSTSTFSKTLSVPQITIAETVANTIENNAPIELLAPSGFYWEDPEAANNTSANKFPTGYVVGMRGFGGYGPDASDLSRQIGDNGILLFDTSTVATGGNTMSGTLVFYNLKLTRTDTIADTPTGDVRVRVRVPGGETEYITVGVFANRTVTMTAEDKTLPEIIKGAYTSDPTNLKNRVLDVTIAETSAQAWNANADAIFTLPKGVKFRGVEVTSVSGLRSSDTIRRGDSLSVTSITSGGNIRGDKLIADLDAQNQMSLSPQKFTLSNIQRDGGSKISVTLRCYVTVDPAFEGTDITFGVDQDNEAFGSNLEPVTVAKAIDPITVTAVSTPIQLGYMNLGVGDIVIKENAAGALIRTTSISSSNSADVFRNTNDLQQALYFTIGGFSSSSNFSQVVFKSKGNTPVISDNGVILDDYKVSGGRLALYIKRESTTPSEIKLSGMTIDTDRSLPQGKLDLKASGIVTANYHGDITDNQITSTGGFSTSTSNRDWAFGTSDITAWKDYVNVITAAPDQDSKYTTQVEVAIGSTTLIADGEEYEIDVAPFLEQDYTMVPVRAVSKAIGVRDDMIRWDANSKAVTILDTNRGRTSQFTQGSNVIKQNGMDIGFDGPSCMNVQGRVFLPFRALGEIVLGCPVDWNPETRTAYFNKVADATPAAPAADEAAE